MHCKNIFTCFRDAKKIFPELYDKRQTVDNGKRSSRGLKLVFQVIVNFLIHRDRLQNFSNNPNIACYFITFVETFVQNIRVSNRKLVFIHCVLGG